MTICFAFWTSAAVAQDIRAPGGPIKASLNLIQGFLHSKVTSSHSGVTFVYRLVAENKRNNSLVYSRVVPLIFEFPAKNIILQFESVPLTPESFCRFGFCQHDFNRRLCLIVLFAVVDSPQILIILLNLSQVIPSRRWCRCRFVRAASLSTARTDSGVCRCRICLIWCACR